MEKAIHNARLIRFATFEVDLQAGEVHKNGLKLKLGGQPFEVLAILLEQHGAVVTREELQKRLWPDTFVDVDHNLNTAINKIREVLGDSAENPRFVETLPRRGYRFIAPVNGDGLVPPKPSVLPRLGLVGVAALVLLAALVAFNVHRWRKQISEDGETPIRSLAVLPFENLSGDPQQDYFADGMTEELITNLGKSSALRVISRTSVMGYKRTRKSLPEIARELNVDAVVEGSVLPSGNRVRVTASLLRAATERHLWADSYESELGDVLALQDQLARTIAGQIGVTLLPQHQTHTGVREPPEHRPKLGEHRVTQGERRATNGEHRATDGNLALARPRRVDPEAYQAYLEGKYYASKRNEEGFKRAASSYRLAIDLDPTYAPAYGALAEVYIFEAVWGVQPDATPASVWGAQPPIEFFLLAKAAGLKALELDDELADAHACLGFIKIAFDWDYRGAEPELKRALVLNPNSSTAHLLYTHFLKVMGPSDEAVREAQKLVELDPLTPGSNFELGDVLYYAHRHDESIAQLKKALKLDPELTSANVDIAWNYLQKGMYTEAVKECQRAVSLVQDQRTLGGCGYVYGLASRSQDALSLIDRLKTLYAGVYLDPYNVAFVYNGLGDLDHAFEWLERADREHSASLYCLRVDPWSDRLRSDPRFEGLLRRMDFPQ